jgi:hypothetical protein
MSSYCTSSVTLIPNKHDSFPCQYVLQTARLYVQEYSSFHTPISVHKILIHRSKIISTATLPTGQLSKEVQESWNKDLKPHKEDFKAKCHRRLVTFTSSFITSTESTTPPLRIVCCIYSPEVFRLILPAETEKESSEEASSSSSEDCSSVTENDY